MWKLTIAIIDQIISWHLFVKHIRFIIASTFFFYIKRKSHFEENASYERDQKVNA